MIHAALGITKRNLLWRRVENVAKLYDADTFRGDIRLGVNNLAVIGQEIRMLAADSAEVSRLRIVEPPVTSEEIVIGKRARDELQAIIDSGGKLEIGFDGDREMQADKYGRLLAYVRIRLPDKTFLYLAEWLYSKKYNRSQLP